MPIDYSRFDDISSSSDEEDPTAGAAINPRDRERAAGMAARELSALRESSHDPFADASFDPASMSSEQMRDKLRQLTSMHAPVARGRVVEIRRTFP